MTVTLTSGFRLGPYEILSPLGAGGMGEVYRARDSRLDRTVAIKILPSHLADDPTLRQRFEREAKAVSSLNHPHICVLHDVGNQDGTMFLVMECIEGETLATRLERGALPLAQALQNGMQIADALDKAHRRGVVHRDLKPGNIMLTASGVKLLDFGLAKTAPPLASGATLAAAVTRTTPVTQRGTVLGTFQYMSPEQVEGKDVDARSDIFSFGSVLYEMVTGRRAFEGKSQLSVASAILEKEPEPISSVQPLTPPALDRAIRRCLAKDPEERWQTARDLLLELKWIAEGGSNAGVPAPVAAHRKMRERLAWSAAAVFLLGTMALAAVLLLRTPKPAKQMRLNAEVGADAFLFTMFGPSAVLSPDGTRLAFAAIGGDQKQHLYVRQLDQLQASVIPGTENARNAFFSPNGEWIGFFSEGKLKKTSVQGEAPITLCEAIDDRGGSWGDDGTIVFTPESRSGLFKISSTGGTPERLTSPDQLSEHTHRWPQVLPGSKAVLFTSTVLRGSFENADIVAYTMSTGRRKKLLQGGFYGRYLSTGHLVYMREGTLFAVPFDAKRLEVGGQPTPIVEGVVTNPNTGSAQFSFSETGNLAYVTGHGSPLLSALYWMDRDGKFAPLRESPTQYIGPTFSPDGKRLAVEIYDGKRNDVWVYDWQRDTLTRFAFTGESNRIPVWTPDGLRITYTIQEKGISSLYWKRSDGAGDAQRLTPSGTPQYAQSWRSDGKFLAFTQFNPETRSDIMILPMEGNEQAGWLPKEPKVFLNTAYDEMSPAFSPDGHWLAYSSNESGNFEVYVQPFPGPGGKWLISTGGGQFPRWSGNGKELFYRTSDSKLMVTTYKVSGDSFITEKPQLWSQAQFINLVTLGPFSNFDLHPDGKRFVVAKSTVTAAGTPVKLTFVLNFFDELRRKAPKN